MPWRLVPLLVTMLAVVSCGCARRGNVHGKVSFQGRPIVHGSVVLVGADEQPVIGRINPDGTYVVNGALAGEARVAVVSPDPEPPPMAGRALPGTKERKKPQSKDPPVDRQKWFPLPRKYEVADTSGVTTIIQGGDNTFDIELK
jgi:hypothetical protein